MPPGTRALARSLRACALLVLCLACAPSHTVGQTIQQGGPISIDPDAAPDSAILDRVEAILEAIAAYGGVEAQVRAGVVRLDGEVAREADAEALAQLVGRIEGVAAVSNQVEATRDVALRLAPVVERLRLRLAQFMSFAPLLIVGLVVFLAIAALGLMVTSARLPWSRIAPNAFIGAIYRQVVRVVFLLAALVIALDVVGATALLGSILGAAGIVGLAVGFGVRDTIENFVSSVMLSLRQPFRPNDLVEIGGDVGRVVRLTSRATVLMTLDGDHIRILNATVFKSKIRNYTLHPERRFTFDLGLDPAADLAAARRTGLDAMAALDFTLAAPPPNAWVESVGDSWVTVRFAAWVDQSRTDFLQARGEAIRVTKAALEAADFALPEPSYRLLMTDLAAQDADDGRRPSATLAPTPAAAASMAVQANAADRDETIERRVEQERREIDGGDLLRADARTE